MPARADGQEGLMSLKSKLKNVFLRLPIIGSGLRFAKRVGHLPYVCNELLGRVTALHDQVQALPNLWAPVSEQVWEAQAVGSQVMADDLRAVLDKARRDHAAILETIDRRLQALEQALERRLDAGAPASVKQAA
jgi:hypothetical protein